MTLKNVVENNDTAAGRLFDIVIQLLILLSITSYSVETLPDLSASTIGILDAIETGCIAAFTLEYLLRVLVATPRRRFVFSLFGVVDLAAILPFYLATGLDLRSLRAVRLLRLIQTLKLVRYSLAVRRFRRAFVIVKAELALFGFVTLLVLYFAAIGIYHFEHDAQPEVFASVFDGLWWALASLTTVGYGDAYPVTVGGRLFTFLVLVVGLGIVAVPTGLIASALSTARQEELADARREEAG